MFGLLTRAGRKKKVPAPRRARPGLECLESRDAPSASTLAPPTVTLSVIYGSGRSERVVGESTASIASANSVLGDSRCNT